MKNKYQNWLFAGGGFVLAVLITVLVQNASYLSGSNGEGQVPNLACIQLKAQCFENGQGAGEVKYAAQTTAACQQYYKQCAPGLPPTPVTPVPTLINRAQLAGLISVNMKGLDMVNTPSYVLTGCFPDTVGNAFEVNICALKKAGLVTSFADGNFHPNDNVNRAEASKFIVDAFGILINTAGGPHFHDVSPGTWYYSYVETLGNNFVVFADPSGNFNPATSLTTVDAQKWVAAASVIISPKPTPTPMPLPKPIPGPKVPPKMTK